MTERPILFSAPMVRALLAETKTQTRRIVKASAPEGAVDAGVISSGNPKSDGLWWWLDCKDLMDASPLGDEFRCPYGVSGDTLWVRENFRAYERPTDHTDGILFSADEAFEPIENTSAAAERWVGVYHYDQKRRAPGSEVPSIHMPRWASRITLRVDDVRVERLNEISEADAKAEGIVEYPCTGPHRGPNATFWSADGRYPDMPIGRTTPVAAYKALWEEINGEDGPTSWIANPWVWAVTFEVMR